MPYYITNIYGKFLKDYDPNEYTFTTKRADALEHKTKGQADQSLMQIYSHHKELRLKVAFIYRPLEPREP